MLSTDEEAAETKESHPATAATGRTAVSFDEEALAAKEKKHSKSRIIADVAVKKHHQQQDEILIFLTYTRLEKISKVAFLLVTQAFVTSVCCVKHTHL